ncbi:MAG: DNA-directed RNA polymerase subunit beta' [Elusimicrobia bacterium]|nr:DNA-directed RNA polymerase subunit beta' [Elusimicrobiota bacterium]MBK7207308.1 DNA-directed RNA polymerase subunit beta' [Elusimicrobiota bacterium]MBK7546121.1 DNA-directed RNA polymerase subunit beta' [Elusimicrobiota bacterium]MBK7575469.1 DNA-directed RNA polymerase subunit beta' [Elusimicrobiota bacterium]MBK7689179.1 DNA-directed RNA polymerase subunit beta' [Elusimicrobiota bacterium]
MTTLFAERKKESAKKKPAAGLNFTGFDAVRITIASPEQISSWSHGEVRKPETINYRTFKPERDGLFCERIFGPVRDWECNCGKFKFIKYKGVVCDRCGVEVTESKVRRERMGHIELAVPVAHVWFLRKSPSRMGTLLGMKLSDIEKVVYYARHAVLEDFKDADGKVKYKARQLLTDEEVHKAKEETKGKVAVGIGAGAIRQLLEEIDVKKDAIEVRAQLKVASSETEKTRLVKRLRVLDGFVRSGTRPENMVLTVLPVIPPDLRPLVPLEGGRFATSDLNDLYRRIINRNNRLKHIEGLRAPEVMVHNEKRLLQEAVDALLENGVHGKVVVGAGNRPLKSLSDILKGKQGRFRQNLLGKRVDYSGRSVIVVGPNLKLHQCGLPKEMALELFKPFIIHELMKRENCTLRAAKRMLERVKPEVWDILEQVTKNHPVLLNRAPTLHRLGIQAFEPVLIEGKAIQLHPLTCAAFNADFDGDQMAVHVPLSLEAQLEARLLMMATNNILSPASGKPIAVPAQDMVLGCAYLTKEKVGVPGEGQLFGSRSEVVAVYQTGAVDLHARIKVRGVTKFEEEGLANKDFHNGAKWKIYTTVGRVIFNEVVPEELGFVNQAVTKKELVGLVDRCYRELGLVRTVRFLDEIKRLGYRYATEAGLSISISDMHIPKLKEELVKKARHEIKDIEKQSKAGVITDSERYNKIIDLWTHVTDQIADVMFDEMKKTEQAVYKVGEAKFNSVYMMADSGARGSRQQIRQLAGMRGLMQKPQKKITGAVGEIIESPIISNFREGLTVLEYFISTHGGRKGLADTALKTADAGYLTRRLVDVAHDITIALDDCGTINGIRIGTIRSGEDIIEPLEERLVGRVPLDSVVNPLTDEQIVKAGEMITAAKAKQVAAAGIDRIRIRSVLTCEAVYGVCGKCYGLNLATGRPVEVGEAVGVIAAQSIGEPGTQLTLRTFHIGGTASRVIQRSQIAAEKGGTVKFQNLRTIKNREGLLVSVARNGVLALREPGGAEKEHYDIPFGARLRVAEGKKVESGEIMAEWDPYSLPIVTEHEGTVKLQDVIDGITMHEEKNRITGLIERVIIEHRAEQLHPQVVIMDGGKKKASYPLPVDTNIVVHDGDKVEPGDVLAKIPQEVSKTKDITGGLPRVAELFEARKPRNSAVISEIDGVVKLGQTARGTMKVTVTNEETSLARDYNIPQGKHLVVYEGDRVGVGEPLTDGAVNPHDILRVRGAKEVQEFLVNEIQEVYRLQGVGMNDKHIEVIVRQMLSNVQITKSGDTDFLLGEVVSKTRFNAENKRVQEAGGELAEVQPVLLGITKASLSSDSFISAASFQETTRVLTDAASSGQSDPLRGLKENVIIGHLIPTGSGHYDRQRQAKLKSLAKAS